MSSHKAMKRTSSRFSKLAGRCLPRARRRAFGAMVAAPSEAQAQRDSAHGSARRSARAPPPSLPRRSRSSRWRWLPPRRGKRTIFISRSSPVQHLRLARRGVFGGFSPDAPSLETPTSPTRSTTRRRRATSRTAVNLPPRPASRTSATRRANSAGWRRRSSRSARSAASWPFQKLFVDTDLCIHGGVGRQKERGLRRLYGEGLHVTGQLRAAEPGGLSRRPSSASASPTLTSSASNVEYRAFPFSHNKGGFDSCAAQARMLRPRTTRSTRGPYLQVQPDDLRRRRLHLPTKPKVRE